MVSTMLLVIGNKNYSSWSLRAWLYLTEAGVAFEEKRIPLFTEGFRDQLRPYNPTCRVPALVDGNVFVWDSWAIIEHVRHSYDVSVDWPSDPVLRGEALSVAAEMHAGFLAVRAELPMNIRMSMQGRWEQLSEDARTEVSRIRDIWTRCLERHGGPYLFGSSLTIPDIVYAPVASRFRTYGIELDTACEAYVEAIHDIAGMRAWTEAARAETEHLEFVDGLAKETPLHPG